MHSLNGLCVIQLKKLLKKNTPNIQTEILVASFKQHIVHIMNNEIQYISNQHRYSMGSWF